MCFALPIRPERWYGPDSMAAGKATSRPDRPILLIEPDRAKREYLRNVLHIEGFNTDGVSTIEEGLAHPQLRSFALVLMGMEHGLASAVTRLRESAPQSEVIGIAERA